MSIDFVVKDQTTSEQARKNTMKNSLNYRNLATLAGLFTTAIMGGCGYQHGEQFYPDSAVRSTGQMAEAQCASGAREDGMLYDMNFHGEKLNSLGEGKLNLILKGTPAGDAVFVYLNMPHDQVAVRQASVTAYLKTAGITDNRIVVAEGPNLNNTSPTAYNLGKIYKAENGVYNGEAAKEDAAAAAGGGGATPGGH
jgi:hypothetical protein